MCMVKLSSLILIVSIAATTLTSTHLIANGSFENTVVAENAWAGFDSSLVNSWDGLNLEIWDSIKNVSIYDGAQYAGLNAHGGSELPYSISQTFETETGGIYSLGYLYSARTSKEEAFWANLNADNNSAPFTNLIDAHIVGQWSVINTSFEAVDLNTTKPYLGSIGNFLDNIFINQILPMQLVKYIHEPLGMLFLGIIVLGVMRSRLLKSIEKNAT